LENNINEATFVIEDLETLKVVADPLRNQIIEVLQNTPQTVKDVADKLGLAPSNLYYHINMLEKHGLIEVVEKRQVANLIEKLYLATSRFYSINPALLNFETSEGKENIFTMVDSTILTTRDDLLRSLHARTFQLEQGETPRPRELTLTRVIANLSDEKANEFKDKLKSLIDEFNEEDTKDPQHQTFALTIALYPSFYFRDLSEEGD
jgi:DNA-binding transcriptional ArsR family regulator